MIGASAPGHTAAPGPAVPAPVPPRSNTIDRTAPFYIDLGGMDLRASPPIRDPRNPLYPPATELPDTQVPPTDAIGNFIIGPTHPAAPETKERTGIAKGRIETFTMSSADSVIYKPGIARAENGFNASVAAAATAPDDSSNLLVTTSRPATWTRPVSVYVPAGYVRGTVAPFMIVGDGEYRGGGLLVPTLDALIAERKIPPIVVIFVGSGGQDAQGSQRGREFDTVSGTYAQWIESEVLPAVERNVPVRLTRDPDGRVAMGGSSAGVAAFTMAWFRPDLYRRVLAFSPTFVNQQWPHDPVLPGGAWQYHSPWMGPALPVLAAKGFAAPTAASVGAGAPLIPNSPRKPIRIWFEVGDQDLFYPVPMADGMHDWVLASENMAAALAAKGYQYQFVLARNAKHVDLPTMAQTLPSALIWVWSGYPARSK
ncbi:esterase family protein [Sphingomonas solaris]|uniref:Esterase family protein n=2 Tax=Alterirhizorhabdus solaris TaxID=2529389 RepID=A0A558R4B0_9SPHN|nr:esterase family protein [Sphingomonas solaris]